MHIVLSQPSKSELVPVVTVPHVNIDTATSNTQEIEVGNASISSNTRDDAMSFAAAADPCQSGIAADERVLSHNDEPILRHENELRVTESQPTDDMDKSLNNEKSTTNCTHRYAKKVVSEMPLIDDDTKNDNTRANGEFANRCS